jgi:plastocyanin
VVGLVLLHRPGRTGVVVIGVAAILFLLGNLPFVASDLSHPSSFVQFSTTVLGTVTAVVGALAMVGALVRWPERAAGRLGGLAVIIVLLGLGFSVVASLFVTNQAAEPGDITVEAKETEFVPDTLRAKAGLVAVHVGNEDLSRHTFTIDALDVDLEIPGGKSRRVEFQAVPGTYDIECDVPGHEDMEGTLTVE